MKKLLTLTAIAVLSANIIAQAPQLMSYQCVVRGAGGELITEKSIGVKTTISRGSPFQIIVYEETYSPNPSTNENGLLTLKIGSGVTSGDFSKIDWSKGPYFLLTEIDPKGGTNYTISGQSQILSVPYALYSERTSSYSETDPVWAAASGNYYTKSNLQTSGQASVHWNNLTNVNANVADLADGSLSGSKVGTGILANNITEGTLPLARLSGITTTQLSPAAGITSGQISSMAAGKITGIGDKQIPRGNGTGLVSGSIIDDGTNIGMGVFSPEAKLHIKDYYGPQFKIGNTNQPKYEWYINIDGSSNFSMLNENNDDPLTLMYIAFNTRNIGIGTTTPNAKLDIDGQVRIRGGNPGTGKVLTSDPFGRATWEPIPAPPVNHIYFEVKLTTSYNFPTPLGVNRKIDFSSGGTVWENQGNAFDKTTSTFTAPEAGIYSFRGAISFDEITPGRLIYPFINAGDKFYYGCWKNATSSHDLVDINITIYMAAGESAYLGGFVIDPNPPAVVYGNAEVDYSFTYFSGAKVR
ncbi:MAG TPA: hypothetical protein PL101_08680 [Bacteroidales bacterium]|jgi:hypothetical protein|nr:hypothetical protein [Bacteroidales bacterium]HQK71170.1 hypothetical protein [Bacteroidales bacterium]